MYKELTVNDFKPKAKSFNLALLACVFLFVLYGGVIGYHIYAIVINWDAFYDLYHGIFTHMTDIGGFFNGIVELIVAPFVAFIGGFQKNVYGTPVTADVMYVQIAEIVLLLFSGIFGFVQGLYQTHYHEDDYYDYIVTSVYIDENNVDISHKFVSKEEQAESHASWVAALVMAFTIFIAPISTLCFMAYYFGNATYNCVLEAQRLHKSKKVYTGLNNGKLKILSVKEYKELEKARREKKK